jgi:branched-chain amino acid transport system ATP-binding protein
MAILEIKDLTVRFGGVQALNRVNVTVETGQIYGLIGPNGAGKSTLFNAIVGVVPPTEGRIFFRKKEITGLKPCEVAEEGIARTFQNLKLFNDMSVVDNVIVGGLCRSKTRFWGTLFNGAKTRSEDRDLREKAESVLESLGMIDLKDKIVQGLPYGQKKAIELARSLATDPDILLLDEPKAGMNLEETQTIMAILKKINGQGLTIFLVEHDMQVVMELSDRISVLDFGVKIAEGTPDEIMKDQKVINAYLGRSSYSQKSHP